MEELVRFRGRRGLTLSARYAAPGGAVRSPVVVVAHAHGRGHPAELDRATAARLLEGGVGVLHLDLGGTGESGGRREDQTLEDDAGDIHDAIEVLAARGAGPIGLLGSEASAAAALEVAARDPRVRALVLRAPDEGTRFSDAARVEAPTLVLQGSEDPLLSRNRVLSDAAPGAHRLVVLPGVGHRLERREAIDLAAREAALWFGRWLFDEDNVRGDRAPRVEAGASRRAPPLRHFVDRRTAGAELAEHLRVHAGSDTLVLGLPKGGLVVAEQIALALQADLDALVTRKLRLPWQPELTLGALAEGGVAIWGEDTQLFELDEADRDAELARARGELEERVRTYRRVLERAPLSNRRIVLVDDGVATGASLRAAVAAVQRHAPAYLAVAVPGGPAEVLEQLARLPGVDELVVLAVPHPFWAVGQLYEAFAPVSSDEVIALLRRAADRRALRSASPTT